MPSAIIAGLPASPISSASPVPVLHHDGATNTCGTFTPEDASPAVLVIGSGASAERISRLAQRHGLDPRALMLFARTPGGST
jgi:hypothetical protein